MGALGESRGDGWLVRWGNPAGKRYRRPEAPRYEMNDNNDKNPLSGVSRALDGNAAQALTPTDGGGLGGTGLAR